MVWFILFDDDYATTLEMLKTDILDSNWDLEDGYAILIETFWIKVSMNCSSKIQD